VPVTRSKELFNVGSWALEPHENRAQVIIFKLNVKVFKEVNEFGMKLAPMLQFHVQFLSHFS